MIVEFSLANFRSFFKIQTLNFRATSLISDRKEVDLNNIATIEENRLLKVVGIYGANASGKSNLIKGLALLRDMVTYSLESEDLSKTIINSFKQSAQQIDHSGFFQIVLLLNAKKYRYGFTLNENADIAKEWLFGPAEKNETFYYKREDGKVSVNAERFGEGLNLPYEKLRADTLFLSFCSSYDGEVSKSIRGFIAAKITIDSENAFDPRRRFILRRSSTRISNLLTNQLVEKGKKDLVLKWMKEVGLPFTDIKIERITGSNNIVVQTLILLSKNIFDSEGKVSGTIPMDLSIDESAGTQKFYSYIGRLNQKFEEGGLYVSDEIDSNFHPSLLQKLIRLFNTRSVNKNNAQLLFTSHDTNLMQPEVMRRDQFYFTEKSNFDETLLYSLSDLKGIRNNADFARQYLSGFYGALPILGNYLEDINS